MPARVARALQPVLTRAADLAEEAWDSPAPATPAPSVSNTFNVTVAMSGGIGLAECEALRDALADQLHAPVEAGAAVIVKLDAGSGSHTVFTGETYASGVTATGQVVRAADALAKLAAARV